MPKPATASAETAAKPTKNRMCKVLDKAALTAERTHELRDLEGTIKAFTFPVREHLPVPYAFAVSLVGNDGFEVLDDKNQVLRPMRKSGAVDLLTLSHDEVVAKLSELRPDALLARAKVLPGGDAFVKGNVSYEDLVEFILAGGAQHEPKPGEPVLGQPQAGPAKVAA